MANKLILPLALGASLLLLNPMSLQAAVVTSLSSVPVDNVNLNLATQKVDVSGPVHVTARDISESNQRSLTQTFVWNSDSAMASVGLLITSMQNASGGGIYFSSNQLYALDIQLLDASSLVVQSTLLSEQFVLTLQLVQPSTLLSIQLATPLNLVNGQTYGFTFRPIEEVVSQSFGAAVSSVAYTAGVGNQRTTVAPLTTGQAYGSANLDLAFYTTVVPEPGTLATTLCGLGALAVGSWLRRPTMR